MMQEICDIKSENLNLRSVEVLTSFGMSACVLSSNISLVPIVFKGRMLKGRHWMGSQETWSFGRG